MPTKRFPKKQASRPKRSKFAEDPTPAPSTSFKARKAPPRFHLRARNPAQQEYMDAIRECDMTFGLGPAGTGKTFIAVAMAVEALKAGEVERVILSRPLIATEDLGFLPGDLQSKVDPYLTPIYDCLYEMLGPEQTDEMMKSKIIEVAPLAFMRGRTLKCAFVILDEAQNATKTQLKMILTRLGKGSKAVINGDMSQIDLPKHVPSGLQDAVRRLESIEEVAICEFGQEDVVRHPLVMKIVRAYED